MIDILPIGSVVLLKDATKKLMIIGLLQVNSEENRLYDYLGVPFPEGFISNDRNYLFNHGDIEEVCFKGFINNETQELNDFINILYDAAQENGIENLEEAVQQLNSSNTENETLESTENSTKSTKIF